MLGWRTSRGYEAMWEDDMELVVKGDVLASDVGWLKKELNSTSTPHAPCNMTEAMSCDLGRIAASTMATRAYGAPELQCFPFYNIFVPSHADVIQCDCALTCFCCCKQAPTVQLGHDVLGAASVAEQRSGTRRCHSAAGISFNRNDASAARRRRRHQHGAAAATAAARAAAATATAAAAQPRPLLLPQLAQLYLPRLAPPPPAPPQQRRRATWS